MQVITIPAFTDNYIFLLLDDLSLDLGAVDPGDAGPVLRYLKKSGRRLTAILNTHHHRDHTGGNKELLKHYPVIPVLGGAGDRGRIPGQTEFLKEGDAVSVSGAKARILDVPGHTRAHIAYFFAGDTGGGELFSGDTVFGGTIGNLFEGTPEDNVRVDSQDQSAAAPHANLVCARIYARVCARVGRTRSVQCPADRTSEASRCSRFVRATHRAFVHAGRMRDESVFSLG